MSDVPDLPDRVLGPAYLLVVPRDVVPGFWTSQGYAPSGDDAPGDFELDPATLPPEVVVVEVDASGRFGADVEGEALLCLADVFGGTGTGGPRYVQGGCVVRPAGAAVVTLQSEGSTSIVVEGS